MSPDQTGADPAGTDARTPRARRLLVPVVLGLLACGGGAFGALSRTWASQRLTTPGLPPDTVTVTGAQAFPLAAALAVVVLTSGLAILATGPRVRRAIGVVVLAVALAAVLTIALDRSELATALGRAVEQSPAFTGARPDAESPGLTVWEAGTYVAFVLAAALGLITTRAAGRWSTMSRRYEAPGTPTDPDDWWKAIDDGQDPTAETGPDSNRP